MTSILNSEGAKRMLDICFAASALVVLAPVIAIVAILVRCRLGSPILFRQERPGLNGHPFEIFKFRTMTFETDDDGQFLPDRERLTPLGWFLRETSLDELPELLNVLKGDMSLVGPRPLVMKYLPYYTDHEQIRHSLRPGITGWAQIHGRNYLPWDKRLAMDVWYVQNRTLLLDFSILFRTLLLVLRREGVAPDSDEIETWLDQERQKKQEGARVSKED